MLIGISREITERLENNRRLEKHADQMERLNQELSRFSFIVAHHLQEPLRTIGSFADLLDRRALLKDGAEEYLGYIRDGVTRAKSLMRDFSMYLDLHYGAERGPVDLDLACEKALATLATATAETPRVEVNGKASVLGHEELLVQLFQALLQNAIIHGRAGQVIEVRFQERVDQSVEVIISDQGPGIPNEALERVFRLFETLETGTRTGLGLALCQKIVELHGGKIWLKNREQGGLEVHFTLTNGEEAAESAGPEPSRETEPKPTLSTLAGLEEELERMRGFSAVAAHDLQEPLRMVSSYLKLLDRREGGQLSEDGKEYLHFAVDGAQRMKGLLDGLMSYAVSGQHGDGDGERPLGEVLAEVLSDLQVAVSESQASLDYADLSGHSIHGLRGRQLLSNLIGNALKYRGADPLRVVIEAHRDLDRTVVTVADNGLGIPTETAEQMFQPFVRGLNTNTQKGAGLGLATCRRLVESWGGQIWCEPNPGGGTRLRFTLPGGGS